MNMCLSAMTFVIGDEMYWEEMLQLWIRCKDGQVEPPGGVAALSSRSQGFIQPSACWRWEI